MNAPRIHPPHVAWRELVVIGVPTAALLVLVFWAAFKYVKPAPPRTLHISTGADVSPYGIWGVKYQALMAQSGVTLNISNSSGAAENLARLRDPAQPVDAGFVQGGMATGPASATSPKLVSLGSLTVEPLWVFYRAPQALTQLSQLAGQRIAIGVAGSGTHALARQLLGVSGVTDANARLSTQRLDEAPAALLAGRVDVVFISGAVDTLQVQQLLKAPDVRLMSWAHAAGYARQFPFIAKLGLPRGSLDFARDVPGQDTDMIGTSVNLIVRDDLHPALMYLLLDTASQLQGAHGLFQTRGEYPAAKGQDLPLADEAQRYYTSGKPFLQRYLPFWLANLVDRLVVLLIPLLAVVVPVVKFLPDVYSWRFKQRIARWYRRLRELEHALGQANSLQHREAFVAQLDEIEAGIQADRIPAMNSTDYYELRGAIDLVRDRLGLSDVKTLRGFRAKAAS